MNESKTYRYVKRLIDITGSLLALILFSPIYLAIVLTLKITSRGPVLHRQQRVGENGVRFDLLRFRTMYPADETSVRDYLDKIMHQREDASGTFMFTNDPRVTRFGRFLRMAALDELPSCINVLKGEMSFVGPRPPVPYEVDLYEEWHKARLNVKPGITGLWQLLSSPAASFDDMVRMDIYYAQHRSVGLDLKIMLLTPLAVMLIISRSRHVQNEKNPLQSIIERVLGISQRFDN